MLPLGTRVPEALNESVTGFYQDWNHEDDHQNAEPETGVKWRQEISPVHVDRIGLSDEQLVAGKKKNYILVLRILKLTIVYVKYCIDIYTAG